MKRLRPAAAALIAAVAAAGLPSLAAWSVRLDPARTRVGMALVRLEVRDLQVGHNVIEGEYEIRIPMAPWLNDRGRIRLESWEPVETVIALGGRIDGRGLSVLDGRTHPVVCDFDTDGTVMILVDTQERELSFRTRYELLQSAR